MTPERYLDLVWWAWPQVNFNPKSQYQLIKHNLSYSQFSQAILIGSVALILLLKVLESTVINLYLISTLKGTTKATTEDVLKLSTLRTSFRIYQAFGGNSRKIDLSQFLSTNSHWLVKRHYAFFFRSERFKFEKTQKNYFVPQRSRKYPYTGMKLIIPMFFPYASKDLSGYFDTYR